MNIVDILQAEVDRIVKEKRYKKEYGRKFVVSVLQESFDKEMNGFVDQKILLTVHCKGISNSRVIFPIIKATYGYDSLEEEIKYLFNSTM